MMVCDKMVMGKNDYDNWQQLFWEAPFAGGIAGACPAVFFCGLSIVFRWSLVSWWNFGGGFGCHAHVLVVFLWCRGGVPVVS